MDSSSSTRDPVANKYTWLINNLPPFRTQTIWSDPFVIGGCRWRAKVQSKAMTIVNLYLAVDGAEDLPLGWRRLAKFSFTILNRYSKVKACHLEEYFRVSTEKQAWFDVKNHTHSGATPINLGPFQSKYGGLVRDGQVKIVVEIKLILDFGEDGYVCKAINLGGDDERIDVYGIPLLPQEVPYMRLFLENHPDTASSFMLGTDLDPCMKRGFLYLLTGVLDSLSKPPQEISKSCFDRARASLVFIRDAWFEVDWFEQTLDYVARQMEEGVVVEVAQDEDSCVSEDPNQHLEEISLCEGDHSHIHVYGIPLLPSEVPAMRLFLENHPDTASSFMLGTDLDPCVKQAFLYLLTGLLDSLSKPPQEISKSCFDRARATLVFIRDAWLEVDWVEQILDNVAREMEECLEKVAREEEEEI
ncbi:unnamed protein product [Microthlaspi erraticum]|uniref:MATH domain-containing protein n=1 Tax=Microthlaspi erraticum TaxID=1685480 RepID=A0A6D2K1V9_9BRAS|nr:unnamed protein product [Microthlaspi erraticum]